jgi:hypothetical protein
LEAVALSVRIHHSPELDAADPSTWPALLREKDIVKRPGYPGILPITQSAFRDAVAKGLIDAPIRFGPRVNVWRRDYIRRLQQEGLPSRRLATAAA